MNPFYKKNGDIHSWGNIQLEINSGVEEINFRKKPYTNLLCIACTAWLISIQPNFIGLSNVKLLILILQTAVV